MRQPNKHNFRELKIWQKSMDLATKIYSVTSKFPTEEKFGLVSQIRRSAVSIPSNIAEGAGRNSNKSFVQFLRISFGSGNELMTQTMLSRRLGYINEDKQKELLIEIEEIQKMNFSLQSRLATT